MKVMMQKIIILAIMMIHDDNNDNDNDNDNGNDSGNDNDDR